MKKFILMLAILICALIAGCQSPESNRPSGTTAPSAPPASQLPEYEPGSIILQPQDSDDYPFERKYRITYYRLWSEFEEALSEEEKQDVGPWFEELSASVNYGETAEEMILVSFIKRYSITREEFDAAVEQFIANNKDYNDFRQEEWEIPNGDIIYTFDNEIINNYYRYE